METIEATEVKRVLYAKDEATETRLKKETEAEHAKKVKLASECAQVLNNVYKHYAFQNVSEIVSDVEAWKLKRVFECNPKLAELAKVHKIESLKYDVPDWIQEASRAFDRWNSSKSNFTQVLQYVTKSGDEFIVDVFKLNEDYQTKLSELEKQFDRTTRKYFTTEDQLKRLDQCKRFISVLNEAGIDYPGKFTTYFKFTGCPFLRTIGNKYVPCLEYILDGSMYPGAPLNRDANYILESVLD